MRRGAMFGLLFVGIMAIFLQFNFAETAEIRPPSPDGSPVVAELVPPRPDGSPVVAELVPPRPDGSPVVG